MYYTSKERIEIGSLVYTHALTKEEAAKQYDVTIPCIVNYVKEYMKVNNIKPIPEESKSLETAKDYNEMTKEQLIVEIMRKDIEVARAKKGYSVKGGGKTKEFITINDSNTK